MDVPVLVEMRADTALVDEILPVDYQRGDEVETIVDLPAAIVADAQ